MQRPLIDVPELPRIFQEEGAEERQVERFSTAWCDLFEQFHEILSHNHRMHNALGEEEDVKKRLRRYEKLLTWRTPSVNGMGGGQRELARSLYIKYAHPSLVRRKLGIPLTE